MPTYENPVAELRARLEHGRIEFDHGHDFMAQCPAHDDRTPSLHVSTGSQGRALLCCHAGCAVEEVCDALGIGLADLHVRGAEERATGLPTRAHASARGGSGSGSGGREDVMGEASRSVDVSRAQEHEDHARPRAGALQREDRLWLLRAYRDGSLPFQPVWRDEWPALPDGTSRVRQLVADHARLVRALLLGADDDRPFVLPSDEVAAELGLGKHMTWRAMEWLASYEVGFLANVGQLPARSGRRGAFLYLPGLGRGSAVEEVVAAAPPLARGVEADGDVRRAVDQREEAGEHVAVFEAVAGDGGEVLEADGGGRAAVAGAGAVESGHGADHVAAAGRRG